MPSMWAFSSHEIRWRSEVCSSVILADEGQYPRARLLRNVVDRQLSNEVCKQVF